MPEQVRHLLQLCNKKSDQEVEREILNNYLVDTKVIIDNQLSALRSGQVTEPAQVISEEQKQQIQDQILNPSSTQIPGISR